MEGVPLGTAPTEVGGGATTTTTTATGTGSATPLAPLRDGGSVSSQPSSLASSSSPRSVSAFTGLGSSTAAPGGPASSSSSRGLLDHDDLLGPRRSPSLSLGSAGQASSNRSRSSTGGALSPLNPTSSLSMAESPGSLLYSSAGGWPGPVTGTATATDPTSPTQPTGTGSTRDRSSTNSSSGHSAPAHPPTSSVVERLQTAAEHTPPLPPTSSFPASARPSSVGHGQFGGLGFTPSSMTSPTATMSSLARNASSPDLSGYGRMSNGVMGFTPTGAVGPADSGRPRADTFAFSPPPATTSTSSHQPSHSTSGSTLRAGAAGWKPWQAGAGSERTGTGPSGPLDFAPEKEKEQDRRGWQHAPSFQPGHAYPLTSGSSSNDPLSPSQPSNASLSRTGSYVDVQTSEPQSSSLLFGDYGGPYQHVRGTDGYGPRRASHPAIYDGYAGYGMGYGPGPAGQEASYPPTRTHREHSLSGPGGDGRLGRSDTISGGVGLGLAGGGSTLGGAGSGGVGGNEDISTIFVVGFPDDMNEREFQNMFTFSHGFEAATLKVPASTLAAREREATAAVVAAAASTKLAAAAAAAGGGYGLPAHGHQVVLDPYGVPVTVPTATTAAAALGLDPSTYEDAYAQMALENSLVGLRGSSAGGGPDGSVGGAGPSTRKQIIGFAKFRTRADALAARDVLSGRKVDAEKGSVLKAEMAKKNLHTKRGLSNETPGQPTLPPAAPSVEARPPGSGYAGVPFDAASAEIARQRDFEAELVERERAKALRQQQQNAAAFDAFHSVPPGPPAQRRMTATEGQIRDTLGPAAFSPTSAVGEAGRLRSGSEAPVFPRSPLAATSHLPASETSRSASPLVQSLGKSLLQQLDEGDNDDDHPTPTHLSHQTSSTSMQPLSPTGGINMDVGRSPTNFAQSLSSRISNLALANPSGQSPAPGMTSPTFGTIQRTHNPADQNPAINTLYVGGLPSTLPSLTGPLSAAHLEDALRNLFNRCPGFRRLSFRSKSNQPMCFVEFESVGMATSAMHSLYGNTLGGLLPQGIRLAYSRNALGVRSGASSHGPNSPPAMSPRPFQPNEGVFQQDGSGGPMVRRPSQTAFDVASPFQQTLQFTPHSPDPASPTSVFATAFSPFSLHQGE